MSLYETVEEWHVPNALLTLSLREMAPDGANGCEGIVLWLGEAKDKIAVVKHLVGLSGPEVVKRPDHLRISPDLMNTVAGFAEVRDMVLVGQIHSHPGRYVDLSPTDLRYGISAPYFLSVVAPHYAQDPATDWADCGVHVYVPKVGFRRISSREVDQRIRLTDEHLPPLTRLGS